MGPQAEIGARTKASRSHKPRDERTERVACVLDAGPRPAATMKARRLWRSVPSLRPMTIYARAPARPTAAIPSPAGTAARPRRTTGKLRARGTHALADPRRRTRLVPTVLDPCVRLQRRRRGHPQRVLPDRRSAVRRRAPVPQLSFHDREPHRLSVPRRRSVHVHRRRRRLSVHRQTAGRRPRRIHGSIDGSVDLDVGLVEDKLYRLDVFHAERQTRGSNFRIDTSICPIPGVTDYFFLADSAPNSEKMLTPKVSRKWLPSLNALVCRRSTS